MLQNLSESKDDNRNVLSSTQPLLTTSNFDGMLLSEDCKLNGHPKTDEDEYSESAFEVLYCRDGNTSTRSFEDFSCGHTSDEHTLGTFDDSIGDFGHDLQVDEENGKEATPRGNENTENQHSKRSSKSSEEPSERQRKEAKRRVRALKHHLVPETINIKPSSARSEISNKGERAAARACKLMALRLRNELHLFDEIIEEKSKAGKHAESAAYADTINELQNLFSKLTAKGNYVGAERKQRFSATRAPLPEDYAHVECVPRKKKSC